MSPQLIVRALGLMLLTTPSLSLAQDPEPDAPPPFTVVYVEGRVDMVRTTGVQPAQAPDLLEEDDRLVTADGRAEVTAADGSIVHLDRDTDTRVDLGVRLRLVRGRLLVHTPRDADPFEVATPAGVVRMEPDGEYDLAAGDLDGDTVIAAIRGRAVFQDGDQGLPIAVDDELRIDPRDRRPRWARAAPPDVFRHWAGARVAATMVAARGHALPAPLAPYAQHFADHGEWTSIAPYGQVWIPTASPDWRPYAYGSWRFTRYGWTWIDADRWAWPVHHFGRWGRHDRRGWFWIPQHTWGPAWVGWAIAADHVAWSPLGWDARPVVDFFAGARVDQMDVWASSWSILPRRSFGGRGHVFGQLEDPRRLPGPVLGGFVSQMVGPRGPAGAYDRYAPRPGRRSWPASGAGPNPGGGARGSDGRGSARRDEPDAFGSAAPARAVAEPGPRRDDAARTRRPGDARPPEDAWRTVAPVMPPDGAGPRRYDERSGGSRARPDAPDERPSRDTRSPNAIRPRYEPPAAAPEPAAPAGRERGDGARERGRSGSGVERREHPRNDNTGGSGSGDSGSGSGSGSGGDSDSASASGSDSGSGGAGARDGGRRERGTAPATAPRGETGSSAGGRRRPR